MLFPPLVPVVVCFFLIAFLALIFYTLKPTSRGLPTVTQRRNQRIKSRDDFTPRTYKKEPNVSTQIKNNKRSMTKARPESTYIVNSKSDDSTVSSKIDKIHIVQQNKDTITNDDNVKLNHPKRRKRQTNSQSNGSGYTGDSNSVVLGDYYNSSSSWSTRSVVDDSIVASNDDQEQGEWITKISGGYINGSGELNRQKQINKYPEGNTLTTAKIKSYQCQQAQHEKEQNQQQWHIKKSSSPQMQQQQTSTPASIPALVPKTTDPIITTGDLKATKTIALKKSSPKIKPSTTMALKPTDSMITNTDMLVVTDKQLSGHKQSLDDDVNKIEHVTRAIQKLQPVEKETPLVTQLNVSKKSSQTVNEKDSNQLQAEHNNALKELQEEYENKLKIIRNNHQKEMKKMRSDNEAVTTRLRANDVISQSKLNELNERFRVFKQQRAEEELEFRSLISERDLQLSVLQSKHNVLHKEYDKVYMKTLSLTQELSNTTNLKAKIQNMTKNNEDLRAEHEIAIQGLRKENIKLCTETEKLCTENEIAIKDLHTKYEVAMKGLRAEHEATMRRLRVEHAASIEIANAEAKKSQADIQRLKLDYETAIKDLKDKYEMNIHKLREEKVNLLAQHESAIKNLKLEHKTEMATIKHLSDQYCSEVEQLKKALFEEQQLRTTQNTEGHNNSKIDNDASENLRLETENLHLHRTVEHYKQIISDTEQMLSRLHGHVEREESRWSQHAADLQQQLDEARYQLDNQLFQHSDQKGHNGSEDED